MTESKSISSEELEEKFIDDVVDVEDEIEEQVEALQEEEPDWDPAEGFDPRWKEEFEGLTYLGHLEDEVMIGPHRFVIHTLNTGEKLQVAQIVKNFENTIAYMKAYKAASVSAAIQSVDGRPIVVTDKNRSVIRQKYEYVVNMWHDTVVDILYEAVDALEMKVLLILQELGVIGEQEAEPATEVPGDSPE